MKCLSDAKQHFERIKHFYETGGPHGFLAATYDFERLSECGKELDGTVEGDAVRDLALFVLRQDLIAECDALIADVDRGPGDELPDGVLRFPTEGAAEMLVVGHGATS